MLAALRLRPVRILVACAAALAVAATASAAGSGMKLDPIDARKQVVGGFSATVYRTIVVDAPGRPTAHWTIQPPLGMPDCKRLEAGSVTAVGSAKGEYRVSAIWYREDFQGGAANGCTAGGLANDPAEDQAVITLVVTAGSERCTVTYEGIGGKASPAAVCSGATKEAPPPKTRSHGEAPYTRHELTARLTGFAKRARAIARAVRAAPSDPPASREWGELLAGGVSQLAFESGADSWFPSGFSGSPHYGDKDAYSYTLFLGLLDFDYALRVAARLGDARAYAELGDAYRQLREARDLAAVLPPWTGMHERTLTTPFDGLLRHVKNLRDEARKEKLAGRVLRSDVRRVQTLEHRLLRSTSAKLPAVMGVPYDRLLTEASALEFHLRAAEGDAGGAYATHSRDALAQLGAAAKAADALAAAFR